MNVPKAGQDASGDSWASVQVGDQLTVLVADGLGQGLEANVASSLAVPVLRENPNLAPQALLERCHLALRSTRGAAVAVARIDRAEEKLTFAGAANVSARIYSGQLPGQHLVLSMEPPASNRENTRIQLPVAQRRAVAKSIPTAFPPAPA